MKKLIGQSGIRHLCQPKALLAMALLCAFQLSIHTKAVGQATKDKVLFISIGDTDDLLHKKKPEDFKVEIGKECQKSVDNVDEVVKAIPGLKKRSINFTGDSFSKDSVTQYLRSNQFTRSMAEAAVVICYVVTHGEADTDNEEELPIIHFPDGKMRSVNLRKMLQEEGNERLVLLMVEACNHEPLAPPLSYGGQMYTSSGPNKQMLHQLFTKNTGYIEMVSAARSYKSYVTGNGGLLAYYFKDYMLNNGLEADWAEVRRYLTKTIYTHQPESDWMETLRGGKRVKVENFKPYISLDYLVTKD